MNQYWFSPIFQPKFCHHFSNNNVYSTFNLIVTALKIRTFDVHKKCVTLKLKERHWYNLCWKKDDFPTNSLISLKKDTVPLEEKKLIINLNITKESFDVCFISKETIFLLQYVIHIIPEILSPLGEKPKFASNKLLNSTIRLREITFEWCFLNVSFKVIIYVLSEKSANKSLKSKNNR